MARGYLEDTIKAPVHPRLARLAEGVRGLHGRLEGHPAQWLVPGEGAATWMNRLAYGERPSGMERLGAAFDVADFVPGLGALGAAAALPMRFRKASSLKRHIPDSEPDIFRSLKADKRLKPGGGGILSDEVVEGIENRARYRQEAPVLPKPADEMTDEDFAQWGRLYDVDMTSTPMQSMGVSDLRTRRELMVPGGLEGEFTIPDLFQIKANNFDPTLLDQGTHNALMNKFIRTYRRPGGGDDVDIFNDLNFALLSPNAPLTQNEFLAQRMRVADRDELGALAQRRGEEGIAGSLDKQFGVGAASRGGLGVKGTADLGNQTDLANLIEKKPDMFRAGEGETLRDVGFRTMNQVPGLSVKTASLGVPWTDLDKANTSAVDLWMIRKNHERLARENPRFKARQDALVEKGQTPEEAAISIIGSGHPNLAYRSKKTGEVMPGVPEYLQPGKLAEEPEQYTVPNEFYKQIMGYVDESRGANPELELFPEQWRLWDGYRGRVEPHEMAHPDWRKLPKMSFNEMQGALTEHKRLGYMRAPPRDGSQPLPPDVGDWKRLYYGHIDPRLLIGMGGVGALAYAASRDPEKAKESNVGRLFVPRDIP